MKYPGALVFLVILLLFSGRASVHAQPPFTTEDADIADKGEWTLEIVNEYDLLQRSLRPSLRQNTFVANLEYGLTKNIEIATEVPILTIFNETGTVPRRPFGFSDVGLRVKVRFIKEKKHSRMPTVGAAFSVRFPTGNPINSLGSGVTNYLLVGIVEKSFGEKIKVRTNVGVLFAGNTEVGALGIRTVKGKLFTGGISIV